MNEPIVDLWRNKIPHRCTLLYWGRKLRFIAGRPRRLVNLRWMHVWTAHAPIVGGETIAIDTRRLGSWHSFKCYHADGRPIVISGPAEVPGVDQ